jgi:hypothetical protein
MQEELQREHNGGRMHSHEPLQLGLDKQHLRANVRGAIRSFGYLLERSKLHVGEFKQRLYRTV